MINVAPRYGRLRSRESNEIFGWENIELISDRGFDVWMDEFKQLKDRYPDRVLIASIMEEYRKDAWHEIVSRCQDLGVDAFELNMSCPHGLPERRMGSAMGENPDILQEVCGWVMGGCQSSCLGQDDSQRHLRGRSEPRGSAGRLRRAQRHQHDSQCDWS